MNSLVVYLVLVAYVAAELPPYMKTCSRNDANFNKCFVTNANDAIKTLVKGDNKLKTPVISPALEHPGATFKTEQFYFHLKETHVVGLDTMKISDAKADFNKNNIVFEVKFDKVDWKGTYEAKDLKNNEETTGKAHIIYNNNEYKINLKYKLDGNNISVEKITTAYIGEPKIEFDMENIDSNKNIEELWNNSGKKGLTDETLVTFAEFLSSIFTQVFKVATYDEIFPA